jgi:hypothetical protein
MHARRLFTLLVVASVALLFATGGATAAPDDVSTDGADLINDGDQGDPGGSDALATLGFGGFDDVSTDGADLINDGDQGEAGGSGGSDS